MEKMKFLRLYILSNNLVCLVLCELTQMKRLVNYKVLIVDCAKKWN